MASRWFYKRKGRPAVGPFTVKKLKELASSGQVLPTDSVRREGATVMVPARGVKGLFPTRV